MGIRKHFEKKPSDEDLKLQDLSLEQEEVGPELKFDPETEITESDWQGMMKQLREDRENNHWQNFVRQAMYMRILAPYKASELNIDDVAWREIKQQLEEDRKSIWRGFAHQAMSMKILQHDKFIELKIDDQAWQGMIRTLERYRNNGNWWAFADQANDMKILQPSKAVELNIDDQAWQGMKQQLEMLRRGESWLRFAHQAMYMKILAADKVEVTDQGLEITMLPPESFKSEKKPRPERKQF